jgi:uncharacterized protein YecT (DUF1311 family)
MPRIAATLLSALLATAPTAWAAGVDCGKPVTKVERATCADSDLRKLDLAVSENFRDALQATQGATRQALLDQQRTWLRARDRNCSDGATPCLLASYRMRLAALEALTARVSAGNPTLANVTPVALLGMWKVDGYLVPGAPGRQVREADRPWYLPRPGATVSGRPGALCDEDGECLPFGLDQQALAAVPGSQAWSSALELPSTAPFYVAYLSGKSEFGLVPRADGSLLAQFNLCDSTLTRCGAAFQVWVPASRDAAVRTLLP